MTGARKAGLAAARGCPAVTRVCSADNGAADRGVLHILNLMRTLVAKPLSRPALMADLLAANGGRTA